MILKASQTLGQSTGLSIGPRRSTSHAGILKILYELQDTLVANSFFIFNLIEGDEWSGGAEQDMEQYLELVMGLHRLMKAEQMLLVGLVPLAQQHTVFEIIVRDALDLVVQDGEVLFHLYLYNSLIFLFPQLFKKYRILLQELKSV